MFDIIEQKHDAQDINNTFGNLHYTFCVLNFIPAILAESPLLED